MYHHMIELDAIARGHQNDLLESSARFHRGRLTPSVFTRGRRGIGLALITAGELLADRRTPRTSLRPAAAGAASGGHAG